MTSELCDGCVMQVMNQVYRGIAIRLNQYENHRTNSEYEHSLVLKIFCFQVINSYAALFNVAFVKETDKCIGSCMKELQTSLISIMVIQLLIRCVISNPLTFSFAAV